MPTVGDQLRLAREAAGLSVNQVAEATKLKTDQVRALETGDYRAFPAPVYIRGSFRTYASLLKLDPGAIVAAFDAESAGSNRRSDAIADRSSGEARGLIDWLMFQFSRLDWRLTVAILILAVVGIGGSLIYSAWQRQKNFDPFPQMGTGMYQPAREMGGNMLPVPTNAPRGR